MRNNLLALALILVTVPARAQLDLPGTLTPLEQGQVAPFPGVLLDQTASAAITTQIEQQKARCQAELDLLAARAKADAARDKAVAQARADADRMVADANRKAAAETAKLLEERLKAEERARISPALTGVAGFIVGAAATILILFGVQEAR